jgi:hypothetical protein
MRWCKMRLDATRWFVSSLCITPRRCTTSPHSRAIRTQHDVFPSRQSHLMGPGGGGGGMVARSLCATRRNVPSGMFSTDLVRPLFGVRNGREIPEQLPLVRLPSCRKPATSLSFLSQIWILRICPTDSSDWLELPEPLELH